MENMNSNLYPFRWCCNKYMRFLWLVAYRSLIWEPEHVPHVWFDKIKKMMKIPQWMNDGLVIHIPKLVAFRPFIHQKNK